MSDPFAGAFNGRTVRKISMVPKNADGTGPVHLSIEFTDDSTLSIETDRPIDWSVKATGIGMVYMHWSPLLLSRSVRARSRPTSIAARR